MLATQQLGYWREGRLLFRDLTLQINPGEVLYIEGDNGTGKTTLLRLLAGLLEPQIGQITWHGTAIQASSSQYRQQLLYIGHSIGLKLELTALENLNAIASLSATSVTPSAWYDALAWVGLSDPAHTPVRQLSAGQRRRVALARLWCSDAPLWLLDEPFTALDKTAITRVEARLTTHVNRGGIVILTSHQSVQLSTPHVQYLKLEIPDTVTFEEIAEPSEWDFEIL